MCLEVLSLDAFLLWVAPLGDLAYSEPPYLLSFSSILIPDTMYTPATSPCSLSGIYYSKDMPNPLKISAASNRDLSHMQDIR